MAFQIYISEAASEAKLNLIVEDMLKRWQEWRAEHPEADVTAKEA